MKGKLDQDGRKLFNKKLKEPEFEVQFREVKAIKEAAKASAHLSMLAHLQQVEASLDQKETTKTEFNMKKLVSVAASLILIATVSYFTVFNTTEVATGQEIFSEYYKPYDNRVTGVQRGADNNTFSELKINAYKAYDLKDFSMSANLLADLLDTDNSAANVFYLGISNLELGNLDEAKDNFRTVANDFEEFEAQSKWYLAMSLLKENTEESVDEAVYSLGALIVDETSFKTDAKAALVKLGFVMSDSGDNGTVTEVNNSNSNGDSPDGSYEEGGKRGFQWGVVTNANGAKYRFFSNPPIVGLEIGDEVIFYGISGKKGKGKGRRSWAIILDTLK